MSSGERKRKRPNRKQQCIRGFGQHLALIRVRRTGWETGPKSVRVTYSKILISELYPEYRGAREIPWEDGGTTLQA